MTDLDEKYLKSLRVDPPPWPPPKIQFTVVVNCDKNFNPINQCDGCRQGLPVKDGNHYKNGLPWIGCTKDDYK